jgi:diguanylate cyclase (GGDEF)-like protein
MPGTLNIRQDIDNGEGWLGRVTLTIGLGDLYRQTAWIGVLTLVAAFAAFAVSALLLNRLKPSVLGPMHGLNRLMARVHGQSDFTVRARTSYIVEIDELGRGFNQMIEKIQDRDRQLARLAFSDNLTGLPNRSAFLDQLEREVQTAMRSGRRLGLLFLDLDGFKGVNDTLGHDLGDRLLVEAAARIREALRPSDVTTIAAAAGRDGGAARLGDDEFTVLVPDLYGVDDVMLVARRIGDLLRRPFRLGEHEVSISGSIGAAVFPDHGRNPHELLRNADAAMYSSKRAGRDNSQLFQGIVAERDKGLPAPDSRRSLAHPSPLPEIEGA